MFTTSSMRRRTFRSFCGLITISVATAATLSACGSGQSESVDTIALVKGAGGTPTTVAEFGALVSDAALSAVEKKLENTTFDGGNVEVSNLSASTQDGKTRVGTATITFVKSDLSLDASFTLTDKSNWELTVVKNSASSPYSPKSMPDLSIDRSQVSGTIGMTDGVIQWNLVGPTVNWNWNKSVTMQATVGISNKCPFSDAAKCPSGPNVFITMPSMKLGVKELNLAVDAVGGFSVSELWMRIEASAGDIALNADNGVKNAGVVMWVGNRKDSFNPDLQLTDLSSLNGGLNAEFCGDFTLKIPKIANKSTSGCARWSTAGFVLGQVGTGGEVSTNYSSPDLDVSGSSITKVAGAAFNSLSASALKSLPNPTVAFNGAVAKLANMSISIGGTTQGVPDKLLKAIGKTDSAIASMKDLPFSIGGVIGMSSLDLTASVPITGTMGEDPMTLKLNKLQLQLVATSNGNASLTVSIIADTTFGYGTTSAPFITTISMTAQVGTDTGLGLVVNAHGVPSGVDGGRTGNTNNDKLSDPQHATWVWKNAFDIPGYNLWNMTTQIGFFGGSPQFGYNSTGYIDPTNPAMDKLVTCGNSNSKQTLVKETCSGDDWLMSQLVTSISLTKPCFAWAFDGGKTGTTLSVSNGVMRTQKFKIGFAPAGCSVGIGDNEVILPPAFAGFQYEAKIGSASASFIFKTSTDGFTSVVDLENVDLGPVTYKTLNLTTNIKTDGTSDTSFVADMSFSSGSFYATGSLITKSDGMYQQVTGDVDVTGGKGSWSWQDNSTNGKQRFSIEKLHFEQTLQADNSGVETSIDLSGSLMMKNASYVLGKSYLVSKNGLISKLHFELTFTHKADGRTYKSLFYIDYKVENGKAKFVGRFDVNYSRRFSKVVLSHRYTRHLDIDVYMQLDLVLAAPGAGSSAVFQFGGSFDADNISGSVKCKASVDSDPDFHCSGRVEFYKKDIGKAHDDWDF